MFNKAIEIILNGSGIIAISRGNYGEGLIRAAEALAESGIRAVEVTFEQNREPDLTADAIRSLTEAFGNDVAVGAGTVLTLAQLRTAKQAGAKYIVSPNTDENLIAETKRLGLGSIPGAMTPTEIVRATAAGADIVKVFPAGALGPEYFAAVSAPLAHIRCAAVGGITPENIAAFKKAGACAFGISSTLFNKKLIVSRRFDGIRAAAAAFIAALNE